MTIKATLTAAIIAFGLATPAFAGDIESCEPANFVGSDGKLDGYHVKSCINGQTELLANYKKSFAFVQKLAVDQNAILSEMDLSTMRSHERAGVFVSDVWYTARWLLQPDYSDADAFKAYRLKYADPTVLREFVLANFKTVYGRITAGAVKGIAGDMLNEVWPVFEKPFQIPIAAAAGQWYGGHCWDSENAENLVCKLHAWFPDAFKEAYGVAASANRAWVAAFLFRRHQEGGKMLVAEYQALAGQFQDSSFWK